MEDQLSDPVYMAWVSEPAVNQCIECHFEGPGFSAIVASNSSGLSSFSRRQEMEAWISKDKHTIARRRVEPFSIQRQDEELLSLISELDKRADLIVKQNPKLRLDRSKIGLKEVPREWVGTSNILSRRICEKLWGEGSVDSAAGYQQFHDACLTCHGGVSPQEVKTRPPGTLTSNPIGIDCMYCHQDGDNSDWEKEHFDSETWRLATPDYKSNKGMRDLVHTSSQASMCLDCHVGNREQGMFVTHAMYAAGHPPLPSVEIETFSKQMPQHWQTPADLYRNLEGNTAKSKADRKTYFEINYPGVTTGTEADRVHWNSRKMILSALTARQTMLKLYRDSIKRDDWGDYSLYDCAACHHELKSDSDRQRRYLDETSTVVALPKTPGRPRQHEWQSPVLDMAYRFGGKALYARIMVLEETLATCFDDQPFGDSQQVAAVCDELLPVIAEAINIAERRPMTPSLTRSVLLGLTQVSAENITSYDAARQLTWAVDVLSDDLSSDPNMIRPEVGQKIDQLHEVELFGLDLDLPAGREEYIFPDSLGKEFKLRSTFTPEALAAHLRAIGKGL